MSENRFTSDSGALENMFRMMIAGMFFARPGIIEKFDADANLADVSPAIMSKKTVDGKVSYEKLPLILRAPIVVPCSVKQGLFLTVPILPGDECLIVFSDRCIDNFVERGGFGPPEAVGPHNLTTWPRIHHLTDGFVIPGTITTPNKISAWSQTAIELRDRDRTNYFSLGENGIEYSDGKAKVTMTNGRVTTIAPNGFYVDTPNLQIDDATGDGTVTGTWRAQELQTAAGFKANTHLHRGVEPGSGNTGVFT